MAGYKGNFLLVDEETKDGKRKAIQNDKETEIKVAPWNVTKAAIKALSDPNCYIQVSGEADPTGCGEGFSYVSVSEIGYAKVRK